jgi:hypothetical protein
MHGVALITYTRASLVGTWITDQFTWPTPYLVVKMPYSEGPQYLQFKDFYIILME